MQADQQRRTAETAAIMTSLGAGVIAGLTVAGVATGPLAPAFLGLAVLTTVALRQIGLNKELSANLTAIQLEADSMFRIILVVEQIAKDNKIPLNTTTVRRFVDKLSNFVTVLIGPDAKRLILAERTALQKNSGNLLKTLASVNQQKFASVARDPKTKTLREKMTSWGSFFNRILSPGEYLRVLVREIIILHIFFSIMMAEFDLFMRAKGDLANKNWVNSDAFKLLQSTNQQERIRTYMASPDFNNLEEVKKIKAGESNTKNANIRKIAESKHREMYNNFYSNEISPTILAEAITNALNSSNDVENKLNEPALQKELNTTEQKTVESVKEILTEEGASESQAETAATMIVEGDTGGTPVNTGRTSGGGRRTHRKHLRRRR